MKQGKTFMLFCWFLFPAKQKKSWHVQVVRTSDIWTKTTLWGKIVKKNIHKPSVESPFYHSSGYFDK